MLKFKCDKNIKEEITEYLLNELKEIMESNEITTLAGNHYDDDLMDELEDLIKINSKGFIFDQEDEIGEEPYGYVSDFFESFLALIKGLKEKYPKVEIDGYFFVNDFGCAEYVLRQGIHTTKDMKDVKFIDQLQCTICGKWVNAEDAYKKLNEFDDLYFGEDLEEPLIPGGYSQNESDACFCICSEKCKNKIELE